MVIELFGLIYALFVLVALIGTSRRLKLWLGSLYGIFILTFVTGSLVIKYKTGYFEDKSSWMESGGILTLGDWVIQFYIIGAIAFLILVNFRIFKKAIEVQKGARWSLVSFGVLFSIIYVIVAYFILFIVGFMFYPFAP